jgi:hypothetical protein
MLDIGCWMLDVDVNVDVGVDVECRILDVDVNVDVNVEC